MTNKPKAIGTSGETAVVKALHRHGFPHAERRALRGRLDAGDILACPGLIIEVKAGAAAKDASDNQVATWLDDTTRERDNAGADIGLLVLARRGIGPANADRWWTVMHASQVALLHGGALRTLLTPPPIVRLTLHDACALLRGYGYGEPIHYSLNGTGATP